MKNTRLIVIALLTALLCASIAYWALKLMHPAERPLAAPQQAKQDINLDAAAGLFGGRKAGATAATNFNLLGVIDAKSEVDSVAIIAAAGKSAQAVAVGGEVAPGVIVREVHPRYVLLSENGASRRLDLPEKMPPSTPSQTVQGAQQGQPVPATQQPGIPMQKALPAAQPPAQPVPQPAQPQPAQPGVQGQQGVQPASSSRSGRRARHAIARSGMANSV